MHGTINIKGTSLFARPRNKIIDLSGAPSCVWLALLLKIQEEEYKKNLRVINQI